jgi:glycosyltransferase involved in cell wall biosynthesis
MRAVLSLPAALRQHSRAAAMALARTVLRRPGLTRRLRALLSHLPGLQAYLYRMVLAAPPQPVAAPAAGDPQLTPRTQQALLQLRRALASAARSAPAPAAAVPGRPRLAFVSPLPPERTGIADYAAQLLPALMAHFDITLVLQQDRVTLAPELAALPQRTAAWFSEHGDEFEHVLYQFGNSPFHSHMFALLQRHPGVVVLHDFFLSSVLAYLQLSGIAPGAWTDALFSAHGYPALQQSLARQDANEALKLRYPCNLAVLQGARRVVVHSAHARALAQQWYGAQATANWDVVPLPRSAPVAADRASVRAALGIAPSTYLVCSFGFVTPSKLCHELVRAWLASALHADAHCQLLLVGANHGGDYGVQLSALLAGAGGRVRIAGWTDETRYRQYLLAADAAVQLRTASRGETSAAVLDCMNYGLPTIVNANGSMAALPDDCVLKLPDRFDEAALSAALEQLRADPAAAHALGARAARWLHTEHRPEHCAALYAQALRQASADADAGAGSGRPARRSAVATCTRQPGFALA